MAKLERTVLRTQPFGKAFLMMSGYSKKPIFGAVFLSGFLPTQWGGIGGESGPNMGGFPLLDTIRNYARTMEYTKTCIKPLQYKALRSNLVWNSGK